MPLFGVVVVGEAGDGEGDMGVGVVWADVRRGRFVMLLVMRMWRRMRRRILRGVFVWWSSGWRCCDWCGWGGCDSCCDGTCAGDCGWVWGVMAMVFGVVMAIFAVLVLVRVLVVVDMLLCEKAERDCFLDSMVRYCVCTE